MLFSTELWRLLQNNNDKNPSFWPPFLQLLL